MYIYHQLYSDSNSLFILFVCCIRLYWASYIAFNNMI